MDDPAILFLKPGAIKPADKRALKTAGVIDIEIDDPTSVNFVRAAAEISSSEMLIAALTAINDNSYASHSKQRFAEAIFKAVLSKHEPVEDPT